MGGHGASMHALHVLVGQRRPLLSHEAARVLARAQLEAAVLGGGGIDADHGGDEEVGIDAPARLLVLMRLKPSPPGSLKLILSLKRTAGSPKRRPTVPRSFSPSHSLAKPAWKGQKFSTRWSTRSPGRRRLGSKYIMARPGVSGSACTSSVQSEMRRISSASKRPGTVTKPSRRKTPVRDAACTSLESCLIRASSLAKLIATAAPRGPNWMTSALIVPEGSGEVKRKRPTGQKILDRGGSGCDP